AVHKQKTRRRGPAGLKSSKQSTFRELETLARTRLAVFFAFTGARIARQQTFRFQRRAEVRIKLDQRAGEAVADSIRLAVRAATGDIDAHVKFFHGTRDRQRHRGDGTLGFEREIVFKGAAVDGDLAVAGRDAHAGDRGFAASGSEKFVGFGGSHKKLVRSFEHGGGLRRVIVLCSLEYFQFGEQNAAETVFRNHAFDGVFDEAFGLFGAELFDGGVFFAAFPAGIAHIFLGGLFFAG